MIARDESLGVCIKQLQPGYFNAHITWPVLKSSIDF